MIGTTKWDILASIIENLESSWKTRGAHVNENCFSIPKRSFGCPTVPSTASALALGALLGGAVTLCSRRFDTSVIFCTAIQSAFSIAVLAVLVPIRTQDLNLEMCSLPLFPEVRPGKDARGNRAYHTRCLEATSGLAAL
jgi:hypothetical protein